MSDIEVLGVALRELRAERDAARAELLEANADAEAWFREAKRLRALAVRLRDALADDHSPVLPGGGCDVCSLLADPEVQGLDG